MKKVNIVIGANYGDEGKGLVTRYLSLQAHRQNQSCLNVLYNGGAQRGHTVETYNNRFVSHHLGSGLFDGAKTYCSEQFILSPNAFLYDEKHAGNGQQKIFVHPNCRVSTIYDMLLNRIVEDSRGANRHGSVGVGIWETVQRYIKFRALSVSEMAKLTDGELFQYFSDIANIYVPKRLAEYHIKQISDSNNTILQNELLKEDMIEDFREFITRCTFSYFDTLDFDTVVFEAGQGLALSDTNYNAYPHVTTSDTGARIPLLTVSKHCNDIEIDYVTRSYFTRHGAGVFPSECHKNCINSTIVDKTNTYGDYQGDLRYGIFDKDEFVKRVKKDIDIAKTLAPNVKTALFVTHMNYCDNVPLNEISHIFDKIYISDTVFAEDILQIK